MATNNLTTSAAAPPGATRRGILGTAAALLAGTAAISMGVAHAAAATGADAALLAACADFQRAVAECEAGNAADRWPDAECGATLDRFYDALDRLTPLRPQTTAGKLAKARAGYDALASLKDFATGREECAAMAALAGVLGIEPPVFEEGDAA
jgi:hypothetical protein